MTTTEGKLYFTALSTLERLEIQFVPARLSMTRTGNLGEIGVIGRSNPLYHWTNGSKTFSLELDFHSETEDRQDVITKVRWLEALASSDGFVGGQERVRLTFGNLFKSTDIWRVKGVQANLELFDNEQNMLPRQAYVLLDLVLDPTNNLLQKDIR